MEKLIQKYRELEDSLEWVDADLDGEFIAEQNTLHNIPIEEEMEKIEDELYKKYGYIIVQEERK